MHHANRNKLFNKYNEKQVAVSTNDVKEISFQRFNHEDACDAVCNANRLESHVHISIMCIGFIFKPSRVHVHVRNRELFSILETSSCLLKIMICYLMSLGGFKEKNIQNGIRSNGRGNSVGKGKSGIPHSIENLKWNLESLFLSS